MLKILLLVVSMFINSAHAAVGVTIGHSKINEQDGLPEISKNQQASVFVCTGKMHGIIAAQCSLQKCLKAFGINSSTTPVKYGKNSVYGGKCYIDGWVTVKGHSLVMVGPKGDNQYIISKSLGDSSREVSMKYLKADNFPVDKGTMVLDYWDSDGGK